VTALRGMWLLAVTYLAYSTGRREGRDQGERSAWKNAAAVYGAGIKEGTRR